MTVEHYKSLVLKNAVTDMEAMYQKISELTSVEEFPVVCLVVTSFLPSSNVSFSSLFHSMPMKWCRWETSYNCEMP